ncbi:MAG: phenylalanine--tRNA ligase subunit alpha [Deltaproteobacteria bacterium]|nr:phenylalanine--tRNA ligase subunit alpha [Candidatus Anaeroferrophillus wilburensis]MBN2889716.1 phenylalanine--tRNA ligase subunit alpha [Deltaproteobacteria bacterium]
MENRLNQLLDDARQALAAIATVEEVEDVRIRFLGRKGEITSLLKTLGTLPADQRPAMGQLANEIKEQLAADLEAAKKRLGLEARQHQLMAGTIDIGLPGRRQFYGHQHPISLVIDDITAIFIRMGFTVARGPEVELDYYNFEALNIPQDHPARQMQDTFYVSDDVVLRTHTSPVQIRVMEQQQPPVFVIVPGKVYRCDSDLTHTPMFHQVEGLMVDSRITFADLKGVLTEFLHLFFTPHVKVRFRPSYFPFTEPSAEVDIACVICAGKGCRVCGNTGWLEVLGCGMVDPAVYKAVNYDPEAVSGFAFGMGVERLAMLRYQIDDLRLFFTNDDRFLQQF